MRSALNSSVVWELTTDGERLFHCGIVRGKKEFFRASLYVWYLQYLALCDDLVDFKLRAGVRYLSFSNRHSTSNSPWFLCHLVLQLRQRPPLHNLIYIYIIRRRSHSWLLYNGVSSRSSVRCTNVLIPSLNPAPSLPWEYLENRCWALREGDISFLSPTSF